MRFLKGPVTLLCVSLLLPGCALFVGEPGQQQAAAVLVACEPLQNGGRIPAPAAGQTCEQEAAQWYQDYSNDLKAVKK